MFQRYIHGEPIYVHITMGNQSTRAVKKLRLSVKQVANICLFSNAIYKCTVASVEHELVPFNCVFQLLLVGRKFPSTSKNDTYILVSLPTIQLDCGTYCSPNVSLSLNVQPSQTIAQTFSIRPLLEDNRDKRGLALDGQIKSEDTNLASSTMLVIVQKLSYI